MDKTIEERAEEYSMRNFHGYYSGFEPSEKRAYIKGANDQRKIDIDNAVSTLRYMVNAGFDFSDVSKLTDFMITIMKE